MRGLTPRNTDCGLTTVGSNKFYVETKPPPLIGPLGRFLDFSTNQSEAYRKLSRLRVYSMFPARCPVWASLGQPREESSKNRWENPGWAERRGYLLQAHFLLDSRHKQSVSLTLEIFSPVLKYFPQQDWWTSWWTSRRTTPAFRAELGGKLIFWQLYQPGYIERYEWLGCPTCESPMSLNSISVKSSPAGTI